MKYLYTIVMAMLVLASCSENERMVYTDTPGIYFPDYVVGADSLVYSFRMKDTDRDTIQIHVKLLGDLLDEAGEYEVIVSENSSAVAGKHYETLQTFSSSDIKVVLDAGHGEPDGGAVGVSGVVEKDINLAIVQKLQEVLESKGFEVILTRSGDSGLQDENAETIRKMKVSDMNKRLDIMKNSHADIFVSIHMNSFGDQKVSGLHIFYDKNHPEIERLAKSIQNKMSEVTGAEMHAVKTADERLFLMKNPPMPAILVECGFLSNPDEEKKLASDEYQSKIAWAIASAIENYTK